MTLSRHDTLCLLVLMAAATILSTDAFTIARPCAVRAGMRTATSLAMASEDVVGKEVTKAPTLNGKMVLPFKVMASGIKNHYVAAVYAVINSQYKRGSGDGWEYCEYVGITRNLEEALQSHVDKQGKDAVVWVRALSFSYPQQTAMTEVASQWRKQVIEAGGSLQPWVVGGEDFFDDDDEDDDEEDEEWLMASVPPMITSLETEQEVVSPFSFAAETSVAVTSDKLAFTRENVDKVLEEVRPYLISDGGNVAVERVDEETKTVYLILEGACGSCVSSTVTMQMGIERVLKENFPELGEVVQVEDPSSVASEPTELTWEAVEAELNRIKPAITAMGGVVRIKSVDPIGVVELEFRGGNKVKQGLELAIQDVPFVKHVKFVM